MACAVQGDGSPSIDHSIRRVAATETAEVLSTMSRARPSAVAASSSSSTTAETRPPASASSAPKSRPLSAQSIAREMPTTRGRNQLEAASGAMPRRA